MVLFDLVVWCIFECVEVMCWVIFVVIWQWILLGIEVFVNVIMIIFGDVVDNYGSYVNCVI